jgi:hypothetical protein
VDSFCCDTACGDFCSACSQAKTGAANGVCSDVTNGTDPDNECPAAAPDDGGPACAAQVGANTCGPANP